MSGKTPKSMLEMMATSYLEGDNALYIEQLYEQYCDDANSVDEKWQQYFGTFGASPETKHSDIRDYFRQLAKSPVSSQVAASPGALEHANNQAQVFNLINAYRHYGNGKANLDPLGLATPDKLTRLSLQHHGLEKASNEVFDTGDFFGLKGSHKLKDIVSALEQTYCGRITAEFMHLSDHEELSWLQQRYESNRGETQFSEVEKINILKHLTAAEGLEKYLGRKYVGQKRFSLEGGTSLIPLLNEVVTRSGEKTEIKEILLGMAHRGRLNVLVNVLGKNPNDLFAEFEGKHGDEHHMGDVKYHLGFSSNIKVKNRLMHLSLAFNPSHLEIVDPVVEGATRAKQRRRKDWQRKQVLPILIHGDAAFSGQGVVMETFAMSQLRGFTTGGTVHVVINNQIGFTTSKHEDVRSSKYCTDIAKMVQAPILHVNGDDPQAAVFAAQIALDYRVQFKKDIVIDLVCYRRHGHNESDEPSATQPIMYKHIKIHPTPRQLYVDKLIAEGVLDAKQANQYLKDYQVALDAGQPVAQATDDLSGYEYAVNWKPYLNTHWRDKYDATYKKKDLQILANKLLELPEGFELQAQVAKIMNDRKNMADGTRPVDWGFAENLAYASLLKSNYPIRLCGQDCGRGTFAHRHAVLHNQIDDEVYTPLTTITNDPTDIIIIDSYLSEEAVLAFEYGFASAEPDYCVIWEAQFGDFANGAQVVIDQFIASGEQKWQRMCGLVMLLPHGYEGMGAEHSSARLERYLQLCAQENMQVCVPTTPAQIYHLLRRQMIRPLRKPLIVMTPKSVLRHKLAVSSLDELANGSFNLIIPEIDQLVLKDVKRVVLCSGKVFYDLLAFRREHDIRDVVLIRVEQLYPMPHQEINVEIKKYTNAKDVVWCQEEPKNQGAWLNIHPKLEKHLARSVYYVGRKKAAAPAVGIPSVHKSEQLALIQEAFKIKKGEK